MRQITTFWKSYIAFSVLLLFLSIASVTIAFLNSDATTSFRLAITATAILGVLSVFFTIAYLGRNLIRPLSLLSKFAAESSNGEITITPPGFSVKEFSVISDSVSKTLNRVSVAEQKFYAAEVALQKVFAETEREFCARNEEVTKTNKLLEEQIRQRELTEKILQANEERYYLAAQATNDVIYEHNLVPKKAREDSSGKIDVESKEYLNTPDMIWLEERIHPDDRERIMSALHTVFDQGTKFWSEEYRFSHFDDQYAYIFDRGYIIYDENYIPTRMIGAMSDFTERKQVEDALKQSEERYRDLIENANDIIYTIDLEGRFTSLNKSGQKLLGYSLDEAREKTIRSIVPPEHEKIVSKMLRQQSEGTPRTDFEIDLLNSDGERLTLEVSNRVLFHESQPVAIQGIARNISERKWAEEQLRFNAMHDSLTGLPNRTLLQNQLRQAIARKYRDPEFQFAVLFLDIDRFKVINDSLGHLVGDKLLICVAETLKECVRTVDTVARLGGDEFVLLLEDVGSLSDAIHVAQRIIDSLAAPFMIDGTEIFTTTSIGITFSETGYKLPEEVLRDSDTAMYRAKSLGKNCYQIFDQEMFISAASLLKTETDLRRALERDEFELHFQPIISLEDGRISEFEALLRWNHPTDGVVSPADFVPIAEDSGLIIPIGNWVIKQACLKLKEWQEAFGCNDLLMSVNLSPKQIARPDLASDIGMLLKALDMDPGNLNLEITESAIMENAETAECLLKELKKLGVWLTTDDFGTGYSSLSYLHKFPIDRLKVDRSFVWNMGSNSKNSEIVRSILMLARSLRMEVVAEGIETNEQLSLLRDLNCQFGQGYLFSKPVDAASATKLLANKSISIEPLKRQHLVTEILDLEYSH